MAKMASFALGQKKKWKMMHIKIYSAITLVEKRRTEGS